MNRMNEVDRCNGDEFPSLTGLPWEVRPRAAPVRQHVNDPGAVAPVEPNMTVTLRWVETNTSIMTEPNVRSRLVVREFRCKPPQLTAAEEVCIRMPPLEALKLL